jgi:hypothetical protein
LTLQKAGLMSRSSVRSLLAAVYVAGACWSGLAFAQGFLVEPDQNWREAEVVMPPPPQEKHLREFAVSAASSNRFFVDESSLDVGTDYVVRYVMVVRSSGGAETVSYEGIRCPTAEHKLYAHGRPDGEWVPPRNPEWKNLRSARAHTPQAALAANYLCDGVAPPRSREAALRGLRDGTERWRN